MTAQTYKSTGTFDPIGVVLGVVLAVVAMVPLSFLYAYATQYIPFIYLNFLVSFGAVFGVAGAYIFGESLGKNRNRAISLLAMLVVAALTLYVFWVTFLYVLTEREFGYTELLTQPKLIMDLITALIEYGWFSIKNAEVKGTFYAILLGVEALCYVAIFIVMWWTALRARIFCENCQKWVESEALPVFFDPANSDALVQEVRAGTDRWVEMLHPTTANPALRLDLADCQHCRALCVLHVYRVESKAKDNGEVDTSEHTLVDNILITPNVREQLKAKVEEFVRAGAQAQEENG